MNRKAAKKVVSLNQAIAIAARAKRNGKKVVTTNGAFDLIHIGHVRNLQKAKSLGDILIVGVNSDKSVRTHKDPSRPIVSEKDRVEIIAAFEAVDYAFIFATPTPIPWLQKIKPNFHAKGSDRKMSQIIERETVEKNGGKVFLMPFTKDHSTTRIIEKIRKIPEKK